MLLPLRRLSRLRVVLRWQVHHVGWRRVRRIAQPWRPIRVHIASTSSKHFVAVFTSLLAQTLVSTNTLVAGTFEGLIRFLEGWCRECIGLAIF